MSGFDLGLRLFGCSVHGYEPLAVRVCEDRETRPGWDYAWWDRTADDLTRERIDRNDGQGFQPVPLWWALVGCRGQAPDDVS